MYAVIFTAKIKQLDARYSEMAERMRQLAMDEYGCEDFLAVTEGDQEVAISYWPSLEHITAWKQQAEHLVAQQLGRDKWYTHYRVQVVEVLREYGSEPIESTQH